MFVFLCSWLLLSQVPWSIAHAFVTWTTNTNYGSNGSGVELYTHNYVTSKSASSNCEKLCPAQYCIIDHDCLTMATRFSSLHTLSRIDFPQQLAAYPELEPFLLKGVRQTAECKRLGNGSFGVVDELYVQGTLCAAKQLHGSLLDPRTQGVDRVISRFV